MAEKDLYLNGLFWKKICVFEDKEYISMHMATSVPPPKSSLDEVTITTFETINFIETEIYDPNYRCVYNLDNPDIYVDLVTKELRSRKQGNSDFSYLRYQEKKKRVEEPITDRWEILDL